MTLLCVVWGPTVEVARRTDAVRWCFKCRRRLLHYLVALDYAEPSYYEPVVVYECTGCGGDHVDFGT